MLSAPVSLSLSLLGPVLLDFQALHPDLNLEMRLSDQPVDLVRDGIDLALRASAELPDSSLVAVPVAELPRVVVATAAYLSRHGRPGHPHGLARHNCLVFSLGSDATDWQFHDGEEVLTVRVRGNLSVDNSLLLIQAVLRDQGLGLAPHATLAPASPVATGCATAAD